MACSALPPSPFTANPKSKPQTLKPKPDTETACCYRRACQVVFLFTLVTGPRRCLSLKLSDTRVYEHQVVGGCAGPIEGVRDACHHITCCVFFRERGGGGRLRQRLPGRCCPSRAAPCELQVVARSISVPGMWVGGAGGTGACGWDQKDPDARLVGPIIGHSSSQQVCLRCWGAGR